MTEKERLLRAVKREACDRPPCICPGGMMNLVTRDILEQSCLESPSIHTQSEAMAKAARAAHKAGCFENYGLPFCLTVEAEALGASVDLGNALCEPRVTRYAIQSVKDWGQLAKRVETPGREAVVLDAIRLLKTQDSPAPVIANLTGPVSLATSLMESTVFYKELRRARDAAHDCMAFVTEHIIRFGRQQIRAGADCIAISDPSASGEILGPALFEEFAAPYLNRLLAALHEEGPDIPLLVHICGRMQKVFPSLARLDCPVISFDALVSLKQARQELPGHAVMGNVSTYTLEFGSPEKVAALTRHAAENGADIIAPACGLGCATPLANMQAMGRAAKSL